MAAVIGLVMGSAIGWVVACRLVRPVANSASRAYDAEEVARESLPNSVTEFPHSRGRRDTRGQGSSGPEGEPQTTRARLEERLRNVHRLAKTEREVA